MVSLLIAFLIELWIRLVLDMKKTQNTLENLK